jgi:phospholipid/cholesterol/gamma-HCH transport system permease protein
MASHAAAPSVLTGRHVRAAEGLFAVLAYLGGVALFAAAAVKRAVRPAPGLEGLREEWVRECDAILCAGVPLVGLVHMGMGSFLAMQAFYGATFLEAVGPLVGVGLFRNVAPLLSGFVISGLLAARIMPDLVRRESDKRQPGSFAFAVPAGPRRAAPAALESSPELPDPLRFAAARIGAAVLAGPILAVWGACAGAVVGWLVSLEVLHVPSSVFINKCFEMMWVRDVLGILLKGTFYGFCGALFSCYEIHHPGKRPGAAAVRAASLGALAILLFNSTFYVLLYMAGPPFGPTVLKPPVS